jgi:precorrin-2 dehydrogenase/sirohydrochlorin ferrochelatase
MRTYPMFVSLEGRHCLVVGAGQVGLRKLASLLDCGAAGLTVIEPAEPSQALHELAARPGVTLLRRGFEPGDLDGVFLAIAATSDPDQNLRIGSLCRQRGIFCNIVDSPELGSFLVPSSVQRGDLTIAISTGGRSPALTKRIRKDLQERFGEEYAGFLKLMGQLRPMLLALGRPSGENAAIFRRLAGSRLLEALRTDDGALARSELTALLPAELHDRITELLDGAA